MVSIYKYEDPNKPGVEQPDAIQPPRRMAGLILNDRIYAILETNGKTEIVQPGDMLSDRLAFVDRIEQDKVVLKTIDRKPKYLVVRLASAPRTNESLTNPTSAGVGPAGPMIPMPRGRRGPMGEAGPGLEAPM